MAEIYKHNYTGRDLMSGGGHTNMQLHSVFLYVFQGVTKDGWSCRFCSYSAGS